MRHSVHQAAAIAAALGGAFAAPAAGAAEFATVVASTPVVVSMPVARQSCSESQQLVQARPSGAGALLGAIAGGVIGHNVGGGFGRAAATGLGVVAGSVIGDQVEANANPPTEVPVRRCRTVTSYEDRVVGYDVMYEHAGQRYSVRLARDPGPRLAVTVRPAQADGGSLPAPVDPEAYVAAAPSPPVVYEPVPRSVVYEPYYYVPAPSVYIAPVIGFGFGYYGGHRGHHRWR